MPTSVVYSGEIRMYSLAMLLVTVMGIYAYRIYKDSKIKNWVTFTIFSLASAYTHYYALIAAVIVNGILFGYILHKSIKNHKDNNEPWLTKDLKIFIIVAITQIVLYLPWLVYFIA